MPINVNGNTLPNNTITVHTVSTPNNVAIQQRSIQNPNIGTNPIYGPAGNGIQSITKTATLGLTDTYTIYFTNGTTTNFTVKNGKGIVSIVLTSTIGLVDTYTITFNDGTTQTFTVTNGEKGDTGDSGVYIGTTEPTDPDINVWLDPSGTQSKISGLVDDTATYPIDKADTLTGLTASVSELNYVDGVTSDIQTQINSKQDIIADLSDIRSGASAGATAVQPSDLATVATSGSYDDLTDKPTIPDAQIQSDWTQSDNTKKDYIKNKPSLATVATSGDYDDLTNKPTINDLTTEAQQDALNSGITSGDVTLIGTALQPNDNITELNNNAGYLKSSDLTGLVPYTGATGAVDLNNKNLKNISNLAVGSSSVDSNEKILSVGQNRIVTSNQNGLFISSTTSQTRKGMYGVPMALEIQFNSNNQAYSYPLGFHDMNSNNQGGQFLFTSFSQAISAASAGDVMVENDKGGLIFNTGNSKSGSKMRFTVGNWASTPQLTLTANNVGIKNLNPNSNYALDVNGTINASNVLINGQPISVETDANVQYISGGGGSENVDLSSLYIDNQGANYTFYYDYDYGTIRNNNQQADESYAYGVVELYTEEATTATVYFRQSSEQGYDFGEISELNEYLTMDNNEDADYVAWSGKDYDEYEGSVTYNLEAGYNYFTIKYIKDSSSESGDDTFEITSITLGSGSGGGSLIDTDTQEEIPLSEINDMPSVLQDIRDSIPDPSNFVTIDTKQMMTAPKAITGTDVPWGSDQVQKNLFMAVSNSNTTGQVEWIGRSMFGANNLTFLMGTINNMAALGAHSWTSAKQGTGAAWADIYINPDGDKAVKIGGSPMVGRPSIMVIQNLGQTNTGTVKINRNPYLTSAAQYKDVACWDDDISKFNFKNISGYSASSNQMLTHDTSGNLKWVNI